MSLTFAQCYTRSGFLVIFSVPLFTLYFAVRQTFRGSRNLLFLSIFSLSLSLSRCLNLSLSFSYLSLFLTLSLLSIFSLASLMDVFVLVLLEKLIYTYKTMKSGWVFLSVQSITNTHLFILFNLCVLLSRYTLQTTVQTIFIIYFIW